MYAKMNVVAKISCYLERSVVSYTEMRKEYLNTATYNTSVLLWIKTAQFDIDIGGLRKLQTVKKQSGFFGPPCIIPTTLKWLIHVALLCVLLMHVVLYSVLFCSVHSD